MMRGHLEPLLLVISSAALSSFAQQVHAAESARPLGVGPEFAKYYKSSEAFTCISNPSISLPSDRINNDFCDCPDGSDEPGTSACAHLSALSPPIAGRVPLSDDSLNLTIALPGFYCKNKGHIPSYLPFTHVNDGVCDYDVCCDGSDEWAHVGGLKCEDRCKEIGKEWRKKDEQRQKSLNAATKKRKALIVEAEQLEKECAERIETLRVQVQEDEIEVQNLERNVEEVEKLERLKVVRKPKSSKGGKVGVLATLAKGRIEELRESLLSLRSQRDDAKGRIAELEGILSTFKVEYNPNFNDEGVKRAVRSWEDYAVREKGAIGSEEQDKDLNEISKPDSEQTGEGVIHWNEFENAGDDEASDVDVLYQFEAYLPPSLRDWVDAKLRSLRILLIENGILAGSPTTASSDGVESADLASARSNLRSAQDTLNANKRSLTDSTDDLAWDYGVDSIFRALKGKCVARDSGEYTYELCWMTDTKQKSKKNGAQTNMGNFVRFDSVSVDEEVPADGKGVGSGERVTLKYENGLACWNGPARSTTVVLACAETDEVWKVVEEEKCVYRMEVGTPAVCFAKSREEDATEKGKDEL